MGKVSYSPGIEFVQGSLAKPKKQNGHNHGDYLIGTHRTAETQNPNCTRIYIRKGNTYERTTPLSTREMEVRSRFTGVAAAVKTRAKSLEYVASDRQAFLEQKDEPNGKKTMKAYLWYICGQAWDQAHPQG